MNIETRFYVAGKDNFEPSVHTRKSIVEPEETLLTFSLDNSLVVDGKLVSSNINITMDLEKAKLLIAKLQEGVDQCEKEAGV